MVIYQETHGKSLGFSFPELDGSILIELELDSIVDSSKLESLDVSLELKDDIELSLDNSISELSLEELLLEIPSGVQETKVKLANNIDININFLNSIVKNIPQQQII